MQLVLLFFLNHLFLKLYFIDYAIIVVLNFPICTNPPSSPCFLRQSSYLCSCPLVMHISSLAIPFPILYFTSPWPFCTYQFVLLNPLTSSPIPPHPCFICKPSKCSVSMILSLFILFA